MCSLAGRETLLRLLPQGPALFRRHAIGSGVVSLRGDCFVTRREESCDPDLRGPEEGLSMTTGTKRDGAVANSNHWRMLVAVFATLVCGLLAVPVLDFGSSLASGSAHFWTAAGVLIAAIIPLTCLTTYLVERQQRKTDDHVRSLTSELTEAITRAAVRESLGQCARDGRRRARSARRHRAIIRRRAARRSSRTAPRRQQSRPSIPHGQRRTRRGRPGLLRRLTRSVSSGSQSAGADFC